MSNRRTLSPSALLELGDISGILHRINGQDTSGQGMVNNVPDQGEAHVELKTVERKKNTANEKTKQKVEPERQEKIAPKPSIELHKSGRPPRSTWEEVMSAFSSGDRDSRKDVHTVKIDGDIFDTLKSTFGSSTTKFINTLAYWFITGNKDKMRAINTKRSPLL